MLLVFVAFLRIGAPAVKAHVEQAVAVCVLVCLCVFLKIKSWFLMIVVGW